MNYLVVVRDPRHGNILSVSRPLTEQSAVDARTEMAKLVREPVTVEPVKTKVSDVR